MIRYDGMPEPEEEEHVVHPEINDYEMIGFIMEYTRDRDLTYNDVKAILQAETEFLLAKGHIKKP